MTERDRGHGALRLCPPYGPVLCRLHFQRQRYAPAQRLIAARATQLRVRLSSPQVGCALRVAKSPVVDCHLREGIAVAFPVSSR